MPVEEVPDRRREVDGGPKDYSTTESLIIDGIALVGGPHVGG